MLGIAGILGVAWRGVAWRVDHGDGPGVDSFYFAVPLPWVDCLCVELALFSRVFLGVVFCLGDGWTGEGIDGAAAPQVLWFGHGVAGRRLPISGVVPS